MEAVNAPREREGESAAPARAPAGPGPAPVQPHVARLLALQRGAGNAAVSRMLARQAGDATNMSITPAYAQGLDDAALAAELAKLDARAGGISDPAERTAAEENLKVLVDEQKRRAAAGNGKPQLQPTDLARPPGLPLDGAFQLVPVDDAPAAVVEQMPEGKLMELVPGKGLQPAGDTSLAPQVLQTTGTGAFGAIAGGNAVVTAQGFAAAGENALGLVAIPQIRNTLGPTGNVAIDLARPLDTWGHTAMYLRQDGKIVWVRGFGPEMTLDFAKQAGAVGSGKASVPGVVESDVSMFKSTMARTVEYPIDAQTAKAIAGQHPVGKGGTGGSPANYTAKPNVFAEGHGGPAQMCMNQNCVMYAVEQVEGHLKGPVGPAGQGSIVDAPSTGTPPGVGPKGTASQGKLYGMIGDAEAGKVTVSQPPGATGAAVAGRMPAALRYIKWGGRVFVVVGIAAGGYEIYAAPPEQRARTTVGVAGGLGGGFAGGAAGGALAGAAAGLVCGPGAPVCSLVLGIGGGLIGGVVGAFGGRALAEAVYDDATAPAKTGSGAPPFHGKLPGECPSCHRETKPVTAGAASGLGDSTLLAAALMSNPQGVAGGKPKSLSEDEVKLMMDFLGMKPPQAAAAAP
jgi:hypothetical protein